MKRDLNKSLNQWSEWWPKCREQASSRSTI